MRRKFFLPLVILLFGCSVRDTSEKSFRDKLSLSTPSGEEVSVESFENEYLLVNFWATWCKPCIREIPSLQRLGENLKTKNVRLIYITDESTERVTTFMERTDLGFETYFMPGAIEKFGLLYLPTTFLVGPDGKILMKTEGQEEWDSPEIEEKILDLIKES